jgi:Bacterial membrane protein YfhO
MNVRYFVRMGSTGQPDPVYSDQHWKVYENRSCLPRAWVVHQAVVEPSEDSVFGRLRDPGFDPLQIALVADNLGENLEPAVEGLQEEVRFESYRPNRLELRVQAGSHGLLVLSEMFFPGWKATVNGRVSPIHKTDGLLRGIVIPDGESRVILQYAPISIMIGAILTFLAPLATLTIAFLSMGRKSPGIPHGEV